MGDATFRIPDPDKNCLAKSEDEKALNLKRLLNKLGVDQNFLHLANKTDLEIMVHQIVAFTGYNILTEVQEFNLHKLTFDWPVQGIPLKCFRDNSK